MIVGGATPPAKVKSRDPGRDLAASMVRGSRTSGTERLSPPPEGGWVDSERSASLATRRRDRRLSRPGAASRRLPRWTRGAANPPTVMTTWSSVVYIGCDGAWIGCCSSEEAEVGPPARGVYCVEADPPPSLREMSETGRSERRDGGRVTGWCRDRSRAFQMALTHRTEVSVIIIILARLELTYLGLWHCRKRDAPYRHRRPT